MYIGAKKEEKTLKKNKSNLFKEQTYHLSIFQFLNRIIKKNQTFQSNFDWEMFGSK